jgi:DNA polymerase elongation subunit (family B)
MPPRKESVKHELVGAFVKDPAPSMYRWVVSEDLDSLYSHLMMQWNISPETKRGYIEELRFKPDPDRDLREQALEHIAFFTSGVVDKYRDFLKENDLVVAANGVLYTREKGFLPKILFDMYNGRKVAKANAIDAQDRYEKTEDPKVLAEAGRWKNEDKVKKTDLNACYGVTTNQYYIFYDHDNAEAITMGGQLAIKWIEGKLNEFINDALGTSGKDFVIAIDTDSVYLKLDELVDTCCAGKSPQQITEFLDRACKQKINPFISEAYQELADYVNAAEQKMSMKRESIADRAIWTGKKHYILNIMDKEGVRYKEPKIELKGIAAVKSDTPPAAREALKEAIRLIMTGTEEDVLDLIERVRQDFMTLPFDEIAFSKGISHMEKYSHPLTIWGKGAPYQVKAALVYNDMLKRHGLTDYPPIFDGDKVRFAYLRQPNICRSDIIATPGPLPKSFKIEEALDRHKQFENGFLVPLRSILDAIGWRAERTSSLEEFFG